jgi:hypothetical protein
MCIEEELEELRESVAQLDKRTASADEWRRIEARAFLALLGGQLQLRSMQRNRRPHLEVGRLVEKLDELRALHGSAQRRASAVESLDTDRPRSLSA